MSEPTVQAPPLSPLAGRPPLSMKITLSISPELDAEIDNMGEDLGSPKGQTVLRALRLLKLALNARKEGKRIAILDDSDNSEQEIEL